MAAESMVKIIVEEIDGMDPELFHPRNPPQDGDVEMGEATQYMRKIYCLAQMVSRELDHLGIEHKYSSSDEESPCSETHSKMGELSAKKDALMELFWCCARYEFKNSAPGDAVGVRKGWKIVRSKDAEGGGFQTFLRKLTGG